MSRCGSTLRRRAGPGWLAFVAEGSPWLQRAAHGGRALRQALLARAARLVGMSLATRLLLVMVSVAAASTVISLLLQHGSLSHDLHRLVRDRLQRAATMLAELVDQHLAAQLDRFVAIASTPQTLANVEAHHAPTLAYFAKELAEQQGAVIAFMARDGTELAGYGDRELRRLALRRLAEARNTSDPGEGATAVPLERRSALLEHDGGLCAVACVPLHDGVQQLGALVAVEPIDRAVIASWARVCRTRIALGAPADGDPLGMAISGVGHGHLWVSTSFDAEATAQANARWNLVAGGLMGLALASIASVFLSRGLVRPIRAIQATTERIGAGDLSIRLDATRRDEVGDVARAFNAMLDRLQQNIRQRLRAQKQISHLAYHDSLTGLGNRRLLQERLAAALDPQQESPCGVAVIGLDLDRFKDINDTFGHGAGDDLLMEVARRLDACVRAASLDRGDRDDTVLVARLGGDEFSVAVTDVDDRSCLEELAERILAALAPPIELRGGPVVVGASLGIAMAPQDTTDVETLLRDSDMAMFHAKGRGGGSYEFYADSMEEIAARRLLLEGKMQRALAGGEFEVFFQPKVDLDSNLVTGVEALLRWPAADDDCGRPDHFIPVAEETGAIVPIGEWVLRTAVQQAMRWHRDGLPPLRVAVNVSVRQIEHRVDFVQTVATVLEETGFDPALLELEITESALLNDQHGTGPLMERLRALGVGLSLDDFGTGYSSLSYLRRLPIDTLKIDRSFVQGIESDLDAAAVVGCIVAMAKVLGLRVVVEGVETKKQQRLLRDLGCNEIQGFLVSPAVTGDEVPAIVRKRRRRRKATGDPRRDASAAAQPRGRGRGNRASRS